MGTAPCTTPVAQERDRALQSATLVQPGVIRFGRMSAWRLTKKYEPFSACDRDER
jgi:hypothetical protein